MTPNAPGEPASVPTRLGPSAAPARVPERARRYVGNNHTVLFGALLAGTAAVAGLGYHLAEFGADVSLQSTSDTMHYVWQTLTTVGYGDVPPKTPAGRISNMVFGTLGIVAMTAKIGLVVSAMGHVRRLKTTGQFRSWFNQWGPARNTAPVVILGGPQDAGRALPLYRRILDDLRTNATLASRPVVILGEAFEGEMPETLQERGAIYLRGLAIRGKDLRAAGIAQASAVIVLHDEVTGDAGTLRTVAAVRSMRPEPELPVLAEIVRDRDGAAGTSHHALFDAVGARPVPRLRAISVFGGELLAPGSVEVYNRLQSPEGDRIEVCATAGLLERKSWRSIASELAPLGVPLAYRDGEGTLHRPTAVDTPLTDIAHVYMVMSEGAAPADTAGLAKTLGVSAPAVSDPFAARDDQPLVLMNAPNAPDYLVGLIGDLRRVQGQAQRPFWIVSDQFPQGLPQELAQLNVTLHDAAPEDDAAFRALKLDDAAAIVLMARNQEDPASDSFTYMSALKLEQQFRTSAHPPRLLAEVVRFDMDARVDLRTPLGKLGVEVMPAVRGQPLVAAALHARGAADVVSRYLAPNQGLMRVIEAPRGSTWRELAGALAHRGTPLQWIDDAGVARSAPRDVDAPLDAASIMLLAHRPTDEAAP